MITAGGSCRMDDVLLITNEELEMQYILDITYNTHNFTTNYMQNQAQAIYEKSKKFLLSIGDKLLNY